MDFAHRLIEACKQRGLTQQALADVQVTQLRRYEAGTNQPTLDVLRALAIALAVSMDAFAFADDERGPADPGLRMRLEAANQLDPDEQAAVRTLIEGALLRHQARNSPRLDRRESGAQGT